jgi:hypothetical protein
MQHSHSKGGTCTDTLVRPKQLTHINVTLRCCTYVFTSMPSIGIWKFTQFTTLFVSFVIVMYVPSSVFCVLFVCKCVLYCCTVCV